MASGYKEETMRNRDMPVAISLSHPAQPHEQGKEVIVEDGSIIVDDSTGEIIDQKPVEAKQIEQDKPDIKAEDIQSSKDSAPSPEEQERIKQRLIDEVNAEKQKSFTKKVDFNVE